MNHMWSAEGDHDGGADSPPCSDLPNVKLEPVHGVPQEKNNA